MGKEPTVGSILESVKSGDVLHYGDNESEESNNAEDLALRKIFTEKVLKDIDESFLRNLKRFPKHSY